MNILIDARLYGLEHAGIGRYVTNLVKYIPKVDKKNKYLLLLRKKYFKSRDIPGNYKQILVDFKHYSLKEQILLPSTINKHNIDFIHFPHFNVPISANIPFVVTIHDLLMHKQKGLDATTLNPLFYQIKRLGYYKVFKHAVLKSRKIIVPSNFVKNELSQVYDVNKEKIFVTYEGLDENIKKQRPQVVKNIMRKYKIKSPYFIYAGSAYPHKNLNRAIEANVSLNTRLGGKQKISLVLVTPREVFVTRLSKLVHDLNAQDYVKLLGFVNDAELSALYQSSIGFLYPSLSEGFGLPGLEAMSVGSMALVSDIPIFKEIYNDSAYYFNPFDFTSIEKAMLDVYCMKNGKRLDFAKKAKVLLAKYSWKKMAEDSIKIYEEAA